MTYWDSYVFPKTKPKVLITFGPLDDGIAGYALIGPLDQPVGRDPKDAVYFEEVARAWSSEREARTVVDERAKLVISRRGL